MENLRKSLTLVTGGPVPTTWNETAGGATVLGAEEVVEEAEL